MIDGWRITGSNFHAHVASRHLGCGLRNGLDLLEKILTRLCLHGSQCATNCCNAGDYVECTAGFQLGQ